MAKVDEPQFDEEGVTCDECPFEGVGLWPTTGCSCWHVNHNFDCPLNMEQYAEACRLAEEAT